MHTVYEPKEPKLSTKFRYLKPGTTFLWEGRMLMKVIDAVLINKISQRNCVNLHDGNLWTLGDEEVIVVDGAYSYDYARYDHAKDYLVGSDTKSRD